MSNIKKIITILLVVLILLAGATYIDYFLVKTKNDLPRIALKHNDDTKQVVIYKAPFYKVWHCLADDSVILGDYTDNDPLCPRTVEYVNGYFTNSAGINISQRDYELMSYNNIYTFDAISNMSSNSDIENAVYVAYEYGKSLYTIKDNSTLKYNSDNVEIAVFNEFVLDGKNYKWKSDLDDETKYYCAKKEGDTYLFSKYTNNTCEDEFTKITMSDRWCSLYKTSTLVYSLEENNDLCEK